MLRIVPGFGRALLIPENFTFSEVRSWWNLDAFVISFWRLSRDSQLDPDSKRYYKNAWRTLKSTSIADLPIVSIKAAHAAVLEFPGSGSNANCALRTLRRVLSFARNSKSIINVPKIALRKEKERSATFSPELEKALLDAAPQPLHDVFLISQDSGLRPDEVIRMRWENVLGANT